jgi:hypothetical protein
MSVSYHACHGILNEPFYWATSKPYEKRQRSAREFDMPRLHVIADANAYIGLSDVQLDALILHERSNAIEPWASMFVVDELVARSARGDAKEAGKGVAALRRMAKHCRVYDGSVSRINFLSDPRHQIGETLFGTPRHHNQDRYDFYAAVVDQAGAESNPSRWPSWLREHAADVQGQVEEDEKKFSDSLWGIVQFVAPTARKWADIRADATKADALADTISSEEGYALFARVIAENLADFLGVTPSEEQITSATEVLKSSFPLPARIFNAFLSRIVKTGADPSKPERQNTIWDMQLCLPIPKSASISSRPVWVVTRDELILQAAKTANVEHLVHRPEKYLSLTGDTDALLSMIAAF